MWELDCQEGWAPKNWCFWTVVLEKTLESPLECKEIQPVLSEGDQPWDFFGRNDAEAETPVVWLPHTKSWLTGKDSDAGRERGQEEKGTTEDEMAGWYHWLDGCESQWTPGAGDFFSFLIMGTEHLYIFSWLLWFSGRSDTNLGPHVDFVFVSILFSLKKKIAYSLILGKQY